MKEKIFNFLKTNPPVVDRRAWWNIAFHIGMKRDDRVRVALNEMLLDGVIRKVAVGKGNAYAAK